MHLRPKPCCNKRCPRLWCDDDIHIVELRRESVESKWQSRIIEDDVDEVVSNMSFLANALRISIQIGWHLRRYMKDDFRDSITPTECVFSIGVVFFIKALCIELGTLQFCECTEA